MVAKTVRVYQKALKQVTNEELLGSDSIYKPHDENPLVSIIVLCHNAELYVENCLNSIYKQTFKDYEIILINDASIDQTDVIVEEYTKCHLKNLVYIKNHKKSGKAYSLNKGIKSAKGKYIAHITGRDEMAANRLRLQVAYLETNPDVGVVGSSYNLIDDRGVPINRVEFFTETEDYLKLGLLFNFDFVNTAITVRASLAKQVAYNAKFEHCEDYDLWCRITEVSKVKNLPCCLMNIRVTNQFSDIKSHEKLQQNALTIFSRELNKFGIQHTAAELVLHMAIVFRQHQRYFNTVDRVQGLNNWLDKIFKSKVITATYKSEILVKLRSAIFKKNEIVEL